MDCPIKTSQKMLLSAIYAALYYSICSCGDPVEVRPYYSEGQDMQEGQQSAGEEEPAPIKTRYVTGVEYPEGYDWKPDIGYGADGAVLFLMEGEERILELQVGYDNAVSADADMHRCINGHLYTDFSTEQETIVKRDGVELFRYFGREMIVSMAERPDGIYTLGKPRAGTGWTYRKNGEIILHKGVGSILHGLHTDGDRLCFSYMDIIESVSGSLVIYYIVRDGVPESIRTTDIVSEIDDAISLDGATMYLAELDRGNGYALFTDSDGEGLEMPHGGDNISGCRFLTESGQIFISGYISGSPEYGDSFWKGTSYLCSSGTAYKVCGCSIDDGECCYAAREPFNGSTVRIFADGNTRLLAPSYEFIYGTAFTAYRGSCCAAIADRNNGNRPMLWTDGELKDYDFNGVFTSISYWRKPRAND